MSSAYGGKLDFNDDNKYGCYDLPEGNHDSRRKVDDSAVMSNFSNRTNNPDVILHQPNKHEGRPSMQYGTPWTYCPSGSRPLERQEYHTSSKSINISSYNISDSPAIKDKKDVIISSPTPSATSQTTLHPGTSLTTLHSGNSLTTLHPGTSSFGSRDWSSDIFSSFQQCQKSKTCCGGFRSFCHDCFCVPCMMCDTAKSLGDKSCLPFIPGTGAAIRFKVRILGGIQGSIANDCLVTSCCCPCAVCQMYREIDDIGLGMK